MLLTEIYERLRKQVLNISKVSSLKPRVHLKKISITEFQAGKTQFR